MPISSKKSDRKPVRAWDPPVNPDPGVRRQLGVRLMRSHAWFPKSSTKVRCRGLPYIDPGGHITGSTLYYWRCSSAQWFATLCRSVWKRLSRRNNAKTKKNKIGKQHIAKIAVYYSITMNDSSLERLLHCRAKGVRDLLTYLVCKLDEPERFLYGQMLNGISWLESRGKPRAKSIERNEIPDYRGFWTFDTKRDIAVLLNSTADHWVRAPIQLIK